MESVDRDTANCLWQRLTTPIFSPLAFIVAVVVVLPFVHWLLWDVIF